jgi:hypothetical protein
MDMATLDNVESVLNWRPARTIVQPYLQKRATLNFRLSSDSVPVI